MFHVKQHSDDTQQEIELLRELSAEFGLRLSRDQAFRLVAHLDFLLEENQRTNLTAIRVRSEAVRLHLLDSLAVLPRLESSPPGRLADLGSGGGFPGIPIAIMTSREVVLVESVGKKVRFLESAILELGLSENVAVLNVRAEQLAIAERGRFGVVVARALTSLPSLVELASPLLMDGGELLAMKGRLSDDELESGRVAGRICGMEQSSVERYTLPGGDEQRAIIRYLRTGRPSVKLPRSPGTAQHKPLA